MDQIPPRQLSDVRDFEKYSAKMDENTAQQLLGRSLIHVGKAFANIFKGHIPSAHRDVIGNGPQHLPGQLRFLERNARHKLES